MTFDGMWAAIEYIGREASTGGYRRSAWTDQDAALREWFAGEADSRGLDLVTDRAGNQWAWWGDPDAAVAAGRPGVVMGSHLDSVPDGGAFDGPLGVVSALAVIDALRAQGFTPSRPIAVASFVDEEGARFGVACAGSRLITGKLDADKARGLRDADGVTMAEAMTSAGHPAADVGPDPETLRRVGTFVELHIEQGRGLVELGAAVGVGSVIWPHGRWRIDLEGEANHAGTTRLEDRRDPMLDLATTVLAARAAAKAHGCVATVGKVKVEPNGVNAIASRVTAWLDARGPDEAGVRAVVEAVGAQSGSAQSGSAQSGSAHAGNDHSGNAQSGGRGSYPAARLVEESWTPETVLDRPLAQRLSALLDGAPLLATGAGHDAGVLATAGLSTAMLFVRNPTGISHSPAEFAEREDCHRGVEALTAVTQELAR
jgi:N-carbamoyl-L-amino-acid hydrolase